MWKDIKPSSQDYKVGKLQVSCYEPVIRHAHGRTHEAEQALAVALCKRGSANTDRATCPVGVDSSTRLNDLHATGMMKAPCRHADWLQQGTPARFVRLEATRQVAGTDRAAGGSPCQECQQLGLEPPIDRSQTPSPAGIRTIADLFPGRGPFLPPAEVAAADATHLGRLHQSP